jgi:hypothetical protein
MLSFREVCPFPRELFFSGSPQDRIRIEQIKNNMAQISFNVYRRGIKNFGMDTMILNKKRQGGSHTRKNILKNKQFVKYEFINLSCCGSCRKGDEGLIGNSVVHSEVIINFGEVMKYFRGRFRSCPRNCKTFFIDLSPPCHCLTLKNKISSGGWEGREIRSSQETCHNIS